MEKRIRFVRILMVLSIAYSLVFSVAGHLFFPDLYYVKIMGHAGFQDSMVKMSGIYGILTAALGFFVFLRPLKNRDIVISLIIIGFGISGTVLYCIAALDFPVRQLVNVFLPLIMGVILIIIYPWKETQR